MNSKTIITCAITGASTRPKDTPYLPIKPDDIAESGLEAADAGASVLHIHVRDPDTGSPSMSLDLYRHVVDRIKKRNRDVLINLTTGPGARYVLNPDNLGVGAPGTAVLSAEKRVKHIEVIKPDLCSLDFNTMHLPNGAIRINAISACKDMARRIVAAGTKPEVELFDSGDCQIATEFYEEGLLGKNPYWQLAMGIKYGWDDTPHALNYATRLLPQGSPWCAFGIGRMQMPFVALAWCLGGHVRVGMEDNIFSSKGVLARSNAELVTKASNIIRDLGGAIATPAETREILKF